MKYTQCEISNGRSRHVAWLPTCHAIVGRKLIIDGLSGYIVERVYTIELSKDAACQNERDYTRLSTHGQK